MAEEDGEGDDPSKPTTTFSTPIGNDEGDDGNVPVDGASNDNEGDENQKEGREEQQEQQEQQGQQEQYTVNASHRDAEPMGENGEDTGGGGGGGNSNGVSGAAEGMDNVEGESKGADVVSGENSGAPVLSCDDVGLEQQQQQQQADTLAGPGQGDDKLPHQHQRDSAGNAETALAINDAAPASQRDSSGEGAKGGIGDRSAPTTASPEPPGWPPYCDPNYRMPGEIDVAVTLDSGEVRNITVKIERRIDSKSFYGGYRHKQTGRVYHHASTQFGQREKAVKKTSHLRTRDTQTFRTKSTTVQTTNECGTQMARKDMHLDNSRDTIKSAGRYQTAAEFWRLRERQTVVIQRFWRGFSARNRVWSRREEKWARKARH